MKYSSSSSCGSRTAVRPPSMPGLALGVEAPPAEPAAQVGRVDRGEAAVGVDVLDPGPDVERVVVLLDPLVGVERLAVSERPLALAARLAGAGGGPCWGAVERHVGVPPVFRWASAERCAATCRGSRHQCQERAGASCAPEIRTRAASGSRTHRAADTAVVNVATSHEAAVNCSGHAGMLPYPRTAGHQYVKHVPRAGHRVVCFT